MIVMRIKYISLRINAFQIKSHKIHNNLFSNYLEITKAVFYNTNCLGMQSLDSLLL